MSFLILNMFFLSNVFAGDSEPSSSLTRPRGLPRLIHPELQSEKHTCGLHSIRAIYASYRLPVRDFNLRSRLGTDVAAFPFFDSTTGTIHFDIFRVLDQDGFSYSVVDTSSKSGRDDLLFHFYEGHYALTLIKRKETGTLHWVVLLGHKANKYQIADSIGARIYSEDETFLRRNVVSTVLIKPVGEGLFWGRFSAYCSGLIEGLLSLLR
ncbi:hypothetical protein CH373_06135 [Leptospira perolatii]|uniref:Peptidase C39 domain-containing protein n=2 Tax=Leptospira perolatii TaxID=2023191 RepID=A0A2M9ZNT5_9LEPT|nr:hypothetical protein CH360_04865 [Leptospira perolatii]PJZ73742.1 hypothetical protein CH373_06135 [Leptospira perolatii]